MQQVVAALGQILGVATRLRSVPMWLVRAAGLVSPVARELSEMRFQWDRPFVVSHDKLAARYPVRVTALDEGLGATVGWWRALRGAETASRRRARTAVDGISG